MLYWRYGGVFFVLFFVFLPQQYTNNSLKRLFFLWPEPTSDGPQCNTRCGTEVIVKRPITLSHRNKILLSRKIKRNGCKIRTWMWTIKKLLWCNIDNQLNQANAKDIFATKSYNTRLNILFLYYFEGAGRKLGLLFPVTGPFQNYCRRQFRSAWNHFYWFIQQTACLNVILKIHN